MKAATASNALVAVTALHAEVMNDVLVELEHYKNAVELLKQRQAPLDALLALVKKGIVADDDEIDAIDDGLRDAIKACGG